MHDPRLTDKVTEALVGAMELLELEKKDCASSLLNSLFIFIIILTAFIMSFEHLKHKSCQIIAQSLN